MKGGKNWGVGERVERKKIGEGWWWE